MDDKVVHLTKVSKVPEPEPVVLGLDPDFERLLKEFKEVMVDLKADGFAAVAVNNKGEVVDTWLSGLPHATMLGALEMLKADYIGRAINKVEEDEW
jgi:hypothetical protein